MTSGRVGLGPILVPAFFVALTIGLGVWQIERLHWKEALLARIAAAARTAPVPLAPGVSPSRFTRVVASGTLDPAFAAAYASDVRDVGDVPMFGVFLLEPLRRPGALPILVDLGWVPAAVSGRPAITVAGPRRVLGYVRPPERGTWLTPNPDRVHRQFYALDPAAIAAATGLGPVAPFTLVALGRTGTGTYPGGASDLPSPPNNHLQYAVTWFTLAAICVVITAAWWWRRLRPAP